MDENIKNENSTTEEVDYSAKFDSMFSQNVVNEEIKNEGREYFDAVHHGELNPVSDGIVMTRSQYIKDVAKIEQSTKDEIHDAKKSVPLYVLIVLAVFVFTIAVNTVCHNIGIEPLLRLSGGVSAAALIIIPALIYFFCYSTFKRIKRARKAQEKAMKTLDMRKEECMTLGTYDASK